MADSILGRGIGRRKTSVARVYVRRGSGKIIVNGRDVDAYFASPERAYVVRQPLEVIDGLGRYDIAVTVSGGGLTGQAGAIRHGLSRALVSVDDTNYATLRANGFMTRDPRMVERKKYGQRGARRRFQFSKR